MFTMFKAEYNDHLDGYDEDHMRDFVDVYIRERKRAGREGDKGELASYCSAGYSMIYFVN